MKQAALQKRKKKLIKEIRVRLYGQDPADYAPDLEQIGLRYATLLAEHHSYKLSACDHVLLLNDPDIPPGQFQLRGMLPVVSTIMYHVRVGVDVARLNADHNGYVTNLIAEILTAIAVQEGSDLEPIEHARKILLVQGADTAIHLHTKTVTTAKYIIEPFLKLKGMGSYSALLYVQITNLSTGLKSCRLVVQAPLYEIRDVASHFSVRDETLVLKAKYGSRTEWYRQRGFQVPVIVPLALFFS
jgi:hypothetical protein